MQKMRWLPQLLLMALHYHANGFIAKQRPGCVSTPVGHHYFQEEYRVKIGGIPADMKMHWKAHMIFFTFINADLQMSLKMIDASRNPTTIILPALGQSCVVDNTNDIVYFATDNGVFKYDTQNNKKKYDGVKQTLHFAKEEDVMYVAVNNNGDTLYIATFPQNRVKKLSTDGTNKEPWHVVPSGSGLTMDGKDNMYFVAAKTSYILRTGQGVANKIRGLPSDRICGIFVSKTDKVFAMDDNSNIYLIQPESASASYLGNFNRTGVNTFAIDERGNVFIGFKGAIVKYKNFLFNPCLKRNSRKSMVISSGRRSNTAEAKAKSDLIWSRRNDIDDDSDSVDYFNV